MLPAGGQCSLPVARVAADNRCAVVPTAHDCLLDDRLGQKVAMQLVGRRDVDHGRGTFLPALDTARQIDQPLLAPVGAGLIGGFLQNGSERFGGAGRMEALIKQSVSRC